MFTACIFIQSRTVRDCACMKESRRLGRKGCFGGPKSEIGALVSLVELLLKEKDADGQRAVDDLKQFLKGTKKINAEHVAGILRKHHKTQFIHWVGCL